MMRKFGLGLIAASLVIGSTAAQAATASSADVSQARKGTPMGDSEKASPALMGLGIMAAIAVVGVVITESDDEDGIDVPTSP